MMLSKVYKHWGVFTGKHALKNINKDVKHVKKYTFFIQKIQSVSK